MNKKEILAFQRNVRYEKNQGFSDCGHYNLMLQKLRVLRGQKVIKFLKLLEVKELCSCCGEEFALSEAKIKEFQNLSCSASFNQLITGTERDDRPKFFECDHNLINFCQKCLNVLLDVSLHKWRDLFYVKIEFPCIEPGEKPYFLVTFGEEFVEKFKLFRWEKM